MPTLLRKNGNQVFDRKEASLRKRVDLRNFPLLDEDGQEVPIYDVKGHRIKRRAAFIDCSESPCGVLMDLQNIQALFNSDEYFPNDDNDLIDSNSPETHQAHHVNVDAYPLGFLRVAGNIQASGVPQCFHPIIREVNESVRRQPSPTYSEVYEDTLTEEHMQHALPSARVVKPITCQFYNHITHRITTRAGRLDSQQGTVTAALSGAFAQTHKDQTTAKAKQDYCAHSLPSDRFHDRIHLPECPSSCRAELVYSVDVRSMRDKSATYVVLP